MQSITLLNKNEFLTTIIKGLLLVTNIAFLVYFVALAIYARPHYDDLHFMWKLQEMSIFDYIKDMYFSRSGRFGGYLLNGIVFSIINALGGVSWFMPVLFIAIGILISSYVAVQVFPKIDRWFLCNGVALFYFLYLLTNIDFAVVYWLCAIGYYLKFPIAMLFFYFINQQKLKLWQWLALILCTFTIGAGNEAFSPLILVFMFINAMFYLHKNAYNIGKAFADNRVKRMSILAAIIIVLMAIVVVAPGNYVRMEDATQFQRPASIADWILGLVNAGATYHYFVLFYVPYYIVLIALAYLLGVKSKLNSWHTNLLDNKTRVLLSLLALYIIYVLCTVLPSVFLYGGFGTQRNYTHAVYMTMLTLCIFGFLYGYKKPEKEKIVKYVSVVGLFLLFAITIVNCRLDFPSAKAYAQSVDERIAYCNKMQIESYQGILDVEPLVEPTTIDAKYAVFHMLGKTSSKPMLYYISDTKEAPNEYAYHMKRVYNWDFDIVLKKLN